jgi:hypothetical protein
MNWCLYFSLAIVLLSYLSSLRIFRLDSSSIALKRFSLFLLFTFVGECFGIAWPRVLYLYTPFGRSNQWFYTVFHFFSYLFYLWFFFQLLTMRALRKTVRILSLIYILFALVNFLFIQKMLVLNTYSDLLACFIMVFLSIAYYYQLLYAKELVSLQRDPFFWISTGVFIYHLGSMMGLFLINVMNVISNEKAMDILLIIQVSAVLMYINYSIAFLCMKKK